MNFITLLLLKEYIISNVSGAISKILKVLLSEKMLMKVVFSLAKKLVASTNNNLDNQLLDMIETEMISLGYIVKDI